MQAILRRIPCILAVVVALVATQAVQAQPPAQKGQPKQTVTASDVEVNGNKVGTVKLAPNGATEVTTLKSGHKVSLVMKDGHVTDARAVDAQGHSLNAEFATNNVAQIVVIVIRLPDGRIIIIIVRRVAA
jgi:hypothetical protein